MFDDLIVRTTPKRSGTRTFKHCSQILEVKTFNRLFGRLALFGAAPIGLRDVSRLI
jgi:hypothetical protein